MTTVPGSASTRAVHRPVTVPFWPLLSAGVITLLFGLGVLAWPQVTLRLVGLMAGVWLLVIGLMRIFGAFRARRDETARFVPMRRIVDGAFGLLLAIVGLACLRDTATGVVAVSVLIGLAWLLSGFAGVLLGAFTAGQVRGWLFGIGAVSVAVGVLFLAWPSLSLSVLVLLSGITAIVLGIAEIGVAFGARHAVAG
ncbi:HdeD family acid-resistance protein [Dactylosporangium sp. NPDC048998]|uniref:HdeD family acid-resistance protein n=1 Tax=Dactylosporangium sp. NPDC048998 TaxID=3363976 RepID=UPI00372444BF